MQYHGSSHHVIYQTSEFDSALELTWFLFLSEIDITKNNLVSHPLDHKHELQWYPDLRFILSNPYQIEVFAEIKPLKKEHFNQELTLSKYRYKNSVTCILGASNIDYQFLNNSDGLTELLDKNVKTNTEIWEICSSKALEFARQFGSAKGFDEPKFTFGKYKGYSKKEIRLKDPNYYKWYQDEFE